jgi:hypothetical protein
VEPHRVELDVDAALATAHDLDLADAVDGLQAALDDILGDAGQLLVGEVALDRQHEDGYRVGIHLLDDRAIDPGGQISEHRGDPIAGLLGGLVAVLLERELGDDRRDALAADRLQRLDARDRVDHALDRVGHVGLDRRW